MSLDAYPEINGQKVLVLPPPEWTAEFGDPNFDNPQRGFVVEHYAIVGVMAPIALVALVQRFYTKHYLSKGLAVDDFFMLLAWMASVVTQFMMLYIVAIKTMGLHIWEVRLEIYLDTRIHVYITAGIFMLCNGFTKLSLLNFYLPLSPQRWWTVCVWSAIGLVSLYTVIITTMLFFFCSPVEKAYKPDLPGHCIDAAILYIATAVSNIVTDIILFILPIPMVMNLKMSMFQKLGAITVFAIGSMTVTTSVVRLVYLMDVLGTSDLTWDAARANVWSLVEANLFIICGSLPTTRRFFKHFTPRLMGVSSNSASGTGQYAQGYAKKETSSTPNRSRRIRSQYEIFDEDQEMQDFANRSEEALDPTKKTTVQQTSVDAVSEIRPDDESDKAILQTKTFTVRYD